MKHGTEEYDRKLFAIALTENVIRDARIQIQYDASNRNKLRAYYCINPTRTSAYKVQFPNHLRDLYKSYTCDIIERKSKNGVTFYSVIKESIRDENGKALDQHSK